MLRLPDAVQPLIRGFEKAFTRPSFERFVALSLGAIVTFGRRTVSRILWTLGSAAAGDPSNYHRLFSRARWSLWPLGKVLACAVLELIPPDQPVLCAIDDTILEHRGNHVYAKACHRNAVGSARGMATRWGHRWVVLAVLVKLPFAARPWALPLLCALYRSAALDQKEHRRHQTPCELARHLLAVLLHWFPQRRFIALGDGGFASHDLAWFAHRHRDRLTFIARANPKMNLHVLPPQHTFCRQTLWRRRRGDIGHPRCRRGHKLASPLIPSRRRAPKGIDPCQRSCCIGMASRKSSCRSSAPLAGGIAQGATAPGLWFRCAGFTPAIRKSPRSRTGSSAPIRC